MKRTVDILGSILGLLILSPLLLLVALAIKLDSDGPILYRSERVGRDGKPFTLYKFRSMTVGAGIEGPGITTADDPRITRMGKVLRRTKLDELPQLINVLRGDMSLVGPRPEDPRYVALYTPEQRKVLYIRPGITSRASIQYRKEEAELVGENWEQYYINTVLPTKLALDLDYVLQPSIGKYVRILLDTFIALWR